MIVYSTIYLMIQIMYYKYYYSFIYNWLKFKRVNFRKTRMTSILTEGVLSNATKIIWSSGNHGST
jgi:hypothetical protein